MYIYNFFLKEDMKYTLIIIINLKIQITLKISKSFL